MPSGWLGRSRGLKGLFQKGPRESSPTGGSSPGVLVCQGKGGSEARVLCSGEKQCSLEKI